MSRSLTIGTGPAVWVALLLADPAVAQAGSNPGELPQSVTIGGSGKTSGVANVNVAAGNGNQQVNVGIIASGNAASVVGATAQHIDSLGVSGGNPATAVLAPGAFAGSSGWLAINGAAGSENQQANVALIAFGIEGRAVADAMLSQTRASHEPTGNPAGDPTSPERNVAIGPGAFENSSGLVQLSLIGGDRNSSANVFALSVSGGANP